MNRNVLEGSLTAFTQALSEVKESLRFLDQCKGSPQGLDRRIGSDAVVKRFEVAFEYAWKLMKVAAEYQGSEAFGPRPAIQEAVRYEWIDDPDFWATALDARNGSVHDYFGISRADYLQLVRQFVEKSGPLVQKIQKLQK